MLFLKVFCGTGKYTATSSYSWSWDTVLYAIVGISFTPQWRHVASVHVPGRKPVAYSDLLSLSLRSFALSSGKSRCPSELQ